ncbi:MAG TPA: hypothetical protein PK114_07805 [Smithellaceae bacterium]|nr:hypothetical protein [Smithellaceae bacterium]
MLIWPPGAKPTRIVIGRSGHAASARAAGMPDRTMIPNKTIAGFQEKIFFIRSYLWLHELPIEYRRTSFRPVAQKDAGRPA